MIVLLMARAGLRRGEVCGLRRSDVHLLPDSRALGCEVARAHLHVARRAGFVVVHYRDDLKAVPGVEIRRLETERHQHDLPAAPSTGLLLCGAKQPRPQPLLAPRLLDPELADFEATTPQRAADSRG